MLCVLVLVVCTTCNLRGYTLASIPPRAESEEDHLAREVDDPTAILSQLQFQDQYTPRNFQTSAQTNTIQIAPDRADPGFFRVSVSANHPPHFQGPAARDIIKQFHHNRIHRYGVVRFIHLQLARSKRDRIWLGHWTDLCVSDRKVSICGKTRLANRTRSFAAKYLGVSHLMVGFLFQNPISFAYTNSSATPQSQLEFQPLISYTLGMVGM